MGLIVVYKATNITGGPHPAAEKGRYALLVLDVLDSQISPVHVKYSDMFFRVSCQITELIAPRKLNRSGLGLVKKNWSHFAQTWPKYRV